MKILKYLIFLFLFIELCAFASLHVLAHKSAVTLVYKPVKFNQSEYLENREKQLGWPSQKLLNSNYFTDEGFRPCPSCPDSSAVSIQTFGDSFTRGAEVTNGQCWTNLIAKNTNIICNNYGVNGFGTDQAYLRYLTTNDDSEIAILGFTSDNILRNVNSYRNLLSSGMNFIGLKPRSILEEGQLEFLPIQGKTQKDIDQLIQNPKQHLQNDYFTNSSEGPVRIKFPFILQFLKLRKHFLIQAKLNKQSFYRSFLEEDHPSNAVNITSNIFLEFRRNCHRKNQKALILLFPQIQDFYEFYETEKWSFQALIDNLEKDNIAYLNLGPALISKMNGETNINNYFAPKGHYNEIGNQVVADEVSSFLDEKNLIPKTSESK